MNAARAEKLLAYWKILRNNGTAAAEVGIVEAVDVDSAVKAAIEKFKIRDPEQQKCLVARRVGRT
jgi:hypothetical protein